MYSPFFQNKNVEVKGVRDAFNACKSYLCKFYHHKAFDTYIDYGYFIFHREEKDF